MVLAIPAVALFLCVLGWSWLPVLTYSALAQSLVATVVVKSEAAAIVAVSSIGAALSHVVIDAMFAQHVPSLDAQSLQAGLGHAAALLSGICMAIASISWLLGDGGMHLYRLPRDESVAVPPRRAGPGARCEVTARRPVAMKRRSGPVAGLARGSHAEPVAHSPGPECEPTESIDKSGDQLPQCAHIPAIPDRQPAQGCRTS